MGTVWQIGLSWQCERLERILPQSQKNLDVVIKGLEQQPQAERRSLRTKCHGAIKADDSRGR